MSTSKLAGSCAHLLLVVRSRVGRGVGKRSRFLLRPEPAIAVIARRLLAGQYLAKHSSSRVYSRHYMSWLHKRVRSAGRLGPARYCQTTSTATACIALATVAFPPSPSCAATSAATTTSRSFGRSSASAPKDFSQPLILNHRRPTGHTQLLQPPPPPFPPVDPRHQSPSCHLQPPHHPQPLQHSPVPSDRRHILRRHPSQPHQAQLDQRSRDRRDDGLDCRAARPGGAHVAADEAEVAERGGKGRGVAEGEGEGVGGVTGEGGIDGEGGEVRVVVEGGGGEGGGEGDVVKG